MVSVLFGAQTAALFLLAVLWWAERRRANALEVALTKTLRSRETIEAGLRESVARESGLAEQLADAAQVVGKARQVLSGKEFEMVVKLPVVKRPTGGWWSMN